MATLQEEMKAALRKRAAAKELPQTNQGKNKPEDTPQLEKRPPSQLTVNANAIQEMKEVLQKRASAIALASSKQNTEDEIRISSSPPVKMDESEHLLSRPEHKKEKDEEVFVESQIHRKGSKVYKNRGWKGSRQHSSSTSCSSRSSSVSAIQEGPTLQETQILVIPPTEQKSPLHATPAERKAYIDKTFDDLLELLASVGAEVKCV